MTRKFVLLAAMSLLATAASAAPTFKINSLTFNNATFVEHGYGSPNYTGDDRSGIAVSGTNVMMTGDTQTGIFDLNLGSYAGTGQRLDGIFNNVRNGDVWALGTSATQPYDGAFNGPQTATHILKINGATGVPTGQAIALSQPISLQGYNCCSNSTGVYSGYDRVLIRNTTGLVQKIDLATGAVSSVGTVGGAYYPYGESWASWGIAEVFGGDDYLVHRGGSADNNIYRTRVSDGQTTTLASFSNLGDFYNFAASVQNGRWYFHWEGGNQLGGYDESLGYADASYEMSGDVPEPAAFGLLGLGVAGLAMRRRRRA